MKTFKLLTDRLLLKSVEVSNLSEVHELLSIPEVDQYNALGIPTNKEVTNVYLQEWIDDFEMRKEFVFSIQNIANEEFMGLVSLKIGNPKYSIGSIWYKLHPDFWSKGYATESARRILKFSFEEIGLHRVEAGCAIENIGSVRVLEKIGMIKEGHKRKVLPLKTGWSDNYEFAMLEEDWK
ncbi:Protein N-acetyltransferase, RimJ/RimL family [Aquimarina amphilecti]|uniref:Protein N-acetyltransferase, RimJ/RimL family n=1 Tax=Aquimarina amphilecti TaxID=1038014 RepID=A0A1H7WVQ0_AQUAM|nr:GNAT family protein [Aquimarina amphilecti]SEM25646.1 Protein N-acetyltransferase, RimJ/RimL family [Aquimarina amphilecti]